MNIHLTSDEVKSSFDSVLGFELLLLQEHWSYELVDGLIVLQGIELLSLVSIMCRQKIETKPAFCTPRFS